MPPPTLIINWTNFTPQQRLTLNTIIDKKRSIHGEKITDRMQVISLDATLSDDDSFRSRHQHTIDWQGDLSALPQSTHLSKKSAAGQLSPFSKLFQA
jgi:hypothetical protein